MRKGFHDPPNCTERVRVRVRVRAKVSLSPDP